MSKLSSTNYPNASSPVRFAKERTGKNESTYVLAHTTTMDANPVYSFAGIVKEIKGLLIEDHRPEEIERS